MESNLITLLLNEHNAAIYHRKRKIVLDYIMSSICSLLHSINGQLYIYQEFELLSFTALILLGCAFSSQNVRWLVPTHHRALNKSTRWHDLIAPTFRNLKGSLGLLGLNHIWSQSKGLIPAKKCGGSQPHTELWHFIIKRHPGFFSSWYSATLLWISRGVKQFSGYNV